jgi:hypothetical protein
MLTAFMFFVKGANISHHFSVTFGHFFFIPPFQFAYTVFLLHMKTHQMSHLHSVTNQVPQTS